MIGSFADKVTKAIFETGHHRSVANDVSARAVEVMDQPDQAIRVEDLRFPSGNRLKKLKGHRPARWSLRVNDQYRITFEWDDENAQNVRFEDCH